MKHRKSQRMSNVWSKLTRSERGVEFKGRVCGKARSEGR
jgi:hypothetical protein